MALQCCPCTPAPCATACAMSHRRGGPLGKRRALGVEGREPVSRLRGKTAMGAHIGAGAFELSGAARYCGALRRSTDTSQSLRGSVAWEPELLLASPRPRLRRCLQGVHGPHPHSSPVGHAMPQHHRRRRCRHQHHPHSSRQQLCNNTHQCTMPRITTCTNSRHQQPSGKDPDLGMSTEKLVMMVCAPRVPAYLSCVESCANAPYRAVRWARTAPLPFPRAHNCIAFTHACTLTHAQTCILTRAHEHTRTHTNTRARAPHTSWPSPYRFWSEPSP